MRRFCFRHSETDPCCRYCFACPGPLTRSLWVSSKLSINQSLLHLYQHGLVVPFHLPIIQKHWYCVQLCRNYVVQYILDLKQGWATTEVMSRLEGNYAYLAMQKFSSNVVEKCLKLGVEEYRGRLVRELTQSSRLSQLLQDQYANYVIQSALSVCKVRSYPKLQYLHSSFSNV